MGYTKTHDDERRMRPLTNEQCDIHREPKVQIWRCEVPANMNGAPRLVCPECLEERAEKAEALLKEIWASYKRSEAWDFELGCDPDGNPLVDKLVDVVQG